jgi:enamine deaminase RidA (YjgF/YER057c/UK114 family)
MLKPTFVVREPILLSEATAEPSVDVCLRRCGQTMEIFINVRPRAKGDLPTQAEALADAAAAVLRQHGAAILQERIFAHPSAIEALTRARTRSFGPLMDPVEPTWLAVPENACGAISGIQIHAVAGCDKATILSVAGRPCGRLLCKGPLQYLVGCNLQADSPDAPACQARSMLDKAEQLLTRAGGTLGDVARTWMWLGNILGWYADFNRVRSEVFAARGLLRPDATGNLPASTGIGIGPAGQQCCTMDFVATLGASRPRFLLGASRQGPASKYGSAFSRAAVADTPAGRTVYVSGTAAIDAAGQTTHLDDPRGQIEDTIRNVRSVLRDVGRCEQDVVQAVVYCKDARVEQLFRREYGNLPIPYVLAIADVCRPNLLFEIEVTAMPQ